MKTIMLKTLDILTNILFLKSTNNQVECNLELVVPSETEESLQEMEQYILSKSLKHVDYINHLESELTSNKSSLFSEDFIEELKAARMSSKINAIISSRNIFEQAA